ncbi:MAG: fibronectin type III domain-containing protein [Schleiferiaceae bacterium]|nr:fibronectin type III domain-containing protein [Schleiferiaceae bacterium]
MFKYRIFFQAALLSLGLLFIGAHSDHAPPCSTSPFLASTKLVEYDSNSVTISWSSSSSVAGYQVEYGPHGFAHGQGTLLQTTQSTTTISGLDPDTAYNFYLRDSCGPGQVGVWSRTYFYVDLPSDSIQPSLTAQPFVQDTLPMGWGNNGSLSRWDWRFIYPNHRAPFLEPEGFAEGVPDHTDSLTSGYAFCKPKFTNGKAWLSTPYFRIDSFQHPYLRFWLFRRDTLNNPAYNFKSLQRWLGSASAYWTTPKTIPSGRNLASPSIPWPLTPCGSFLNTRRPIFLLALSAAWLISCWMM